MRLRERSGERVRIGHLVVGLETYQTTVTIELEPLEADRTLVTIAEEGWRSTPEAQVASYGNCEGWTAMLIHCRAWLEHGLNLREGFYV